MEKNRKKSVQTGLEIAVIGMAGRFPGAGNIEKFWDNLKNGVESVIFYTEDELETAGIGPELLANRNYIRSGGGVLEDANCFDAPFFGYLPGEAEIMDPQSRIFHECAWEALEDAGCNPNSYNGMIGIYAGAANNPVWEIAVLLSGKDKTVGEYNSGNLSNKEFLSLWISYKLSLKGPAIEINTSCSTSLVAIHMACRALWTKECDIALAGGVAIGSLQKSGYFYQEGMITSSDGHCRAFDARATGTVSGNGAAVVVLKKLKEAVNDRDNIYAVIKGTAVNNDGIRKAGFTAPSIEGQSDAVKTALHISRVEPESIGYIETHGTGTIIGDPIEIEALTLAFNTAKKNYCAVGSVKTNIGHLDTAAGAAGFIKAVLALKHRQIPPSLHFQSPNPKIDFRNSPFFVNTELREWKSNHGYPLRAGVSSFGIGGTNAHAVLEEYSTAADGQESFYRLILLSAKTETALEQMTRNLAGYLQKNTGLNLDDAAYTLSTGREVFEYKKAVICTGLNDAVDALVSSSPDKVKAFYTREKDKPVVFMFPGQGSQYVNMGLGLYREEPVFREEMNRCFEILVPIMAYNIKEIIYPNDLSVSSVAKTKLPGINRTEITQPAIFCFEYALTRLLMNWGIKPYAMIGHSIGEYTAACLAGVFSLEDALTLVNVRGRLIQQMPGGSMLSVPLSQNELEPLLLNHELSVAAVNGTTNCVVSGTHETINVFEKRLKEKGYDCSRLHTSHAFHSPMMDPVLKEFEDLVSRIRLNRPQMPYISNVTGNWITVQDVKNPAYWAAHLRETVRFEDGLSELLKIQNSIFVEVGPGKSLSTFVRQHKDKKAAQSVLNLVRHPKKNVPDKYYLLSQLGELWLYGVKIDWPTFYADEKRYRIPLPTYPFERRYCHRIDEELLKKKDRFLLQQPWKNQTNDSADFFYIPAWRQSPPVPPAAKKENAASDITWLIFIDGNGIGTRLVQKLKSRKYNVITAAKGRKFHKTQERHYCINPEQADDYTALFRELAQTGTLPRYIVHLWGVNQYNDEELDIKSFTRAQYPGLYSLIYLAQAAVKQHVIDDLKIAAVSANIHDVTGQEILNPEKSTVLAAVKVIPQELPTIRCCNIDIDIPVPGTPAEDKLLHQLTREIESKSADTVIAFRNNRRWVRIFEAVHLEKIEEGRLPLRKGGVYLVTGGTGKIGLLLAEYLARQVGARLILTGRSSFTGKEDKIRKIENAGGEVMVMPADISNYWQMQEVINRAEARFGPVNGVIHAAGVTRGNSSLCSIENIDANACEEQFIPKVYGLFVLEKLFRNKELDFLALTSSLASVLGGLGLTCYSAANIFMDAFTLKYNRFNTRPWISINWDGWQLEQDKESQALKPQEGIEAFEQILAWGEENQVVVCKSDLQARIDRWINFKTFRESETGNEEQSSVSRQSRPEMTTPYALPRNRVEKTTAEIWEKFFGIHPVGIHDDFFELGGDSLKVTTVLSRMRKELKVEIPLAVFFNRPTIARLTEYIDSAEKNPHPTVEPVEKKEYYTVSPAQRRLFIVNQLDTGNLAYNLPTTLIIKGELDYERLTGTFRELIMRHESFRTSFEMWNGEPVQRIHEEIDFAIEYYDLSREAWGGKDKQEEIADNFIHPFDLSRVPLLRVRVIKSEEEKYILMVDMHHIVSDGISTAILMEEFMLFYKGEKLSPLIMQYRDYSEWQSRQADSVEMEQQEQYWLKTFAGDIPVLDLPVDYARPPVQTFEGDSIDFTLAGENAGALKELALNEGTTLYMIILSVYNVLLAKLSGREDIVIGTTTAGRKHQEFQQIIGIFVNTLVLRNQPSREKTFRQFLGEVGKRTIQAFDNQDYSFEELVDKIAPDRDRSRNPLFDILFVMLNIEFPEMDMAGVNIQPYAHKRKAVQFDLSLICTTKGENLHFAFQYNVNLFKKDTIEIFIEYFIAVISSVLDNPDKKISDIELVRQREENILSQFTQDMEDE
jgi:polyketide synthase PksJ